MVVLVKFLDMGTRAARAVAVSPAINGLCCSNTEPSGCPKTFKTPTRTKTPSTWTPCGDWPRCATGFRRRSLRAVGRPFWPRRSWRTRRMSSATICWRRGSNGLATPGPVRSTRARWRGIRSPRCWTGPEPRCCGSRSRRIDAADGIARPYRCGPIRSATVACSTSATARCCRRFRFRTVRGSRATPR